MVILRTSKPDKPMEPTVTPTRQDLLQALAQIQNHRFFANVDIMTITGCGMSDDEVRQHIDRNIESIAHRNFEEAHVVPKRRGRKAA